MLKESVTPQDVCDLLNGLLKSDREFVTNLVRFHAPCNTEIAGHPTIQVRGYKEYPNVYTCGIVGILNGIFGIRKDGFGSICYEIDDESGNITEFKTTEGVKTKEPNEED